MVGSFNSDSPRKSSADDIVKQEIIVDEKTEGSSTSLDLEHGDEALQIIGIDRTASFSDEYNAKLRRKLDLLIPPLCAVVYFTQFLDKTSLNYASVMGLPIIGQQYNLVSLAFYMGFLLWEFPTVYIAQRLRLAKYLGANIVVWGILLMLHSVGTSFGAFFALRFLLGMCEACVAPILILIIGMFYKKNEQASRVSWFYVSTSLTMIFGGFVAYGITFDNGHVIAAYKLIFILLGALAILVGIAVMIWLPDSPVQARFLTKEERIAVLERVRDDQGGTENKTFKKHQMMEAFTDIRTWMLVFAMLIISIPNGALTNFSNIVIKSFGYTSKQALILSTPAGAVVALTTLFVGWYSDRKNDRMGPVVFALIGTIVGSAILIGLKDSGHKGALLFAIYIISTFQAAISLIYAYNASNTSGYTKKATVNAMTLAAFAVGNIIGAEIFQPNNAPEYIPGKVAILVLMVVELALTLSLRWINVRLNKKKRDQIAELKAKKGWSDADVQRERDRHAFADLTDRENIYFVYAP